MMYSKKLIVNFFFLVLIALGACYTPPEFPIEPTIGYNNIEFKEGAFQDSLIIYISFQDGDGDLGLDPIETQEPYNDVWYFNIGTSENPIPLSYSDRFTPPFDTLPPYEFPYTCTNYTTSHGFTQYEGDTLYFQSNPDHFNIFVEYFVRKNGEWTEFDWALSFDPQCNDNFDGRFPLLGDDDSDTPLEGILRYGMVSGGFEALFRLDTLKLRLQIKDRALNNSNIIETPEFVLRDIKVEDDQ